MTISNSALASMKKMAFESPENSIYLLYQYTEGEWEWYSPNMGGRKDSLPQMLEISKAGYRILPENIWHKWEAA